MEVDYCYSLGVTLLVLVFSFHIFWSVGLFELFYWLNLGRWYGMAVWVWDGCSTSLGLYLLSWSCWVEFPGTSWYGYFFAFILVKFKIPLHFMDIMVPWWPQDCSAIGYKTIPPVLYFLPPSKIYQFILSPYWLVFQIYVWDDLAPPPPAPLLSIFLNFGTLFVYHSIFIFPDTLVWIVPIWVPSGQQVLCFLVYWVG